MEITLIIPAYNEEKYVGPCLESVLKSGGHFKEIIVVDNASTDQTAQIAQQYAGVRVVTWAQKGLTHARQAGFDATMSEIVAFMDADCLMPYGWYDRVQQYFATLPDAVSVSGPVEFHDGRWYERTIMLFLEWITVPLAYFLAGYMIIGGNFAAKRAAIQEIGGFDRNIAFFGEDADLGRRLAGVGKVYLRMDVVVSTSMRRYQHDGFVKTSLNYTFNFIWHRFFKKSFTETYTDARV